MNKLQNGRRGFLKEIVTTYEGLAAVVGIAIAAIITWSYVGPAIKSPIEGATIRSEISLMNQEHQVIRGEHVKLDGEINGMKKGLEDLKIITMILLCLEVDNPLTLYSFETNFDIDIDCDKVRRGR